AYTVASALLTLGEHIAGVAVNGEATAFVPILVFGAGTDYTLFILSRYRPALTEEREAPSAMRRALRAVAEPILASGGVVFLATRSEEHTSELQSQSNLVCRLLLEKKK